MWIAVLSVLGTLGLGAAVGAYVGARVAHRLREEAEKAREDRERDALLRLVHTEINLNRQLRLQDYIREDPEENSPSVRS